MSDKSESRNHPRILLANEPHPQVWLTVQGEIASFSKLQAGVLNAGPGGVCLLTDAPLELGQLLTFHDTNEELPLPQTGIVVWTAETMDGFRLGVQSVHPTTLNAD